MARIAGRLLIALTVAAFAGVGVRPAGSQPAETTVSALAQRTHFHGIAIADAGLYLATHHGLWLVAPDGAARQLSERSDDLMGFTPHPTRRATLYASGHPAQGGNLGFMASEDGGRTWRRLAAGVGGPVDFHQMDVSKADPRVIYGVYAGLQRSADGGQSWTVVGPAPEGLIAIAASGQDTERLYAATRTGLLRSADGGRSWRPAYGGRAPVTTVHVAQQGSVFAFVLGIGLVKAADRDGTLDWRTIGGALGNEYLLHIAAAQGGDKTLYAVAFDPATKRQAVKVSEDGGATWREVGTGPQRRGR